jgi:hypothetical protein
MNEKISVTDDTGTPDDVDIISCLSDEDHMGLELEESEKAKNEREKIGISDRLVFFFPQWAQFFPYDNIHVSFSTAL